MAIDGILPTEPVHYEEAAALFRRCRRKGETARRLIDCLIAAIAIRTDVPVLHRDGDFDVLVRVDGCATRSSKSPGERARHLH